MNQIPLPRKVGKKILILSMFFLLLSSFLMFSFVSQAATFGDINQNIKTQGQTAGYDTGSNYTTVIAQIIKTVLGIIGALFVALIVYGGFLWMTAETGAGRNQLDKAKKVIIMAVVGLVIIIAAYAITTFIISTVNKTTQQGSEAVSLLLK